MSYFKFNNKRIFYQETGNGEPLVFLHGNTASSNMFAEISQCYEERYKVILIDFLGHGQSDRLDEFPIDLWYYEAQQVVAFLKEKQYSNVNLIGTSGGALVAINVALEAPELIHKIIADSFEGETALKEVTEFLKEDREKSKHDQGSKEFYMYMHGSDWEHIVDNDTKAATLHEQEIKNFFHQPISSLKADILLTGSKEDEFVSMLSNTYFEKTYGDMLRKIGHGQIYLFETGRHPALLSNPNDFLLLSLDFFDGNYQMNNL